MIIPMFAKMSDHLPSGKDYLYEIKMDGQRTIAEIKGKSLLLYTRNHQNVTDKYPELSSLPQQVKAKSAILDGEIVALQKGIPSFELLQQRMNLRDKRALQVMVSQVPIIYYVFDIIELDGKPVMKLSLSERKKLLSRIFKPGENAKILPSFDSRDLILDKAHEFGYEGVVAKRKDSPYLPGVRSDWWIKFKFQQQQAFLICGWLEGGRVENFGALLLGKYHGRREIRYVGRAGTGYTERMIHYLLSQLRPLEIKDPVCTKMPAIPGKKHWVKPTLWARVRFKEWTKAEILRAPVFVGLGKE
jgi:bifunctional non-homologous end joining protein LigD